MSKQLHDPITPGPLLAQLAFLLGDFAGHGEFADGRGTFSKTVSGQAEAGGRFIGLRMEASYPLPDGSVDTHSAFVVVGTMIATPSVLTARAYTDSGSVHDYQVDVRDQQLVFADVLPDHGQHWTRARKILMPKDYGFEERLEVATGDGDFVPYYRIAMRRVDAD